MIELPYEVKLKIVIDNLNIKCTNLQREKLDKIKTIMYTIYIIN